MRARTQVLWLAVLAAVIGVSSALACGTRRPIAATSTLRASMVNLQPAVGLTSARNTHRRQGHGMRARPLDRRS